MAEASVPSGGEGQAVPVLSAAVAERALGVVDFGIIVLNAELRVLLGNPQVSDLLGTGGPVQVGSHVQEVFGDLYGQVDWVLSVVQRTGQSKQTWFAHSDESGGTRCTNVSVSLLEDAKDRVNLVMSLSDITEHYQTLTKNAQTEKMAAVGLLAAGIAHEFNNIWASVQGYAELAKQNESFSDELVDICIEQSARAGEIIHALLSFSDLRVDLRHGVRLGRILRAIQRLVSLELHAKGIEFNLEVTDDPVVAGNEGMLQQIFLNLVINAYQSIKDKGAVGVWLGQEGGDAVVRVRDTGSGMEPEEVRRLFEPFYTTKGAFGGNEDVDGHGLGLTLTYNLVGLHGGKISVESRVGEGSVFTVSIPVAPEEEMGSRFRQVANAKADAPSGLNILVVEDEAVLQGLVCNMLTKHCADAVATGEDAITALGAIRIRERSASWGSGGGRSASSSSLVEWQPGSSDRISGSGREDGWF